MEYGTRIPSDFYIVINNDYIGKISAAKSVKEEYNLGYTHHWRIEMEMPIFDFDLSEVLISSTFDLYEVKYTKRVSDAKDIKLYYKYSDCEIGYIIEETDAKDIGNFCITIYGMSRESIAALPNIIKE